MSRVNRLICAAAISLLALGPISASASPTPSPTLDTLLTAPPGGYTELTASPFHGKFTAHDYAQASDSSKADQIEQTLMRDGFVDGYGMTWIHQASQHALVEAVIAFTGAKGAKSWLISAEAGDKADPTYDHAVSISGISPYYGGHFKYSSSNTIGDVFSFVKGNDVFIVGFVSTRDDILSLATQQTKTQYDSAPKETIPSSQWPENASSAGAFPVLAVGIVGILIVLAVVAVLALTMRRRGAMAPAMAGMQGAIAAPSRCRPTATTGGTARPGAMRHMRCRHQHRGRAMAHSGGMDSGGARRPERANPPRRRRAPEVSLRSLIAVAAVTAILVYPMTAFAAPTPSPTLDTLLAEPPESGYEENSQAVSLNGEFGVDEYVDFLGPDDPSVTQKALQDDGFVSGFGKTWIKEASDHLLLEVVISFVKGNDYFLIGLVSTADDLGDAASTQTRRQFDTAPAYTIPPSQWPESARSILADPSRIATTAAYVLGGVVVLALLTGLILLVLVRSRRRPAAQLAGATALHVTTDGRYWWDGQAWRDSSRDVPPGALKSEDGHYWWDGGEWRLIEQSSS